MNVERHASALAMGVGVAYVALTAFKAVYVRRMLKSDEVFGMVHWRGYLYIAFCAILVTVYSAMVEAAHIGTVAFVLGASLLARMYWDVDDIPPHPGIPEAFLVLAAVMRVNRMQHNPSSEGDRQMTNRYITTAMAFFVIAFVAEMYTSCSGGVEETRESMDASCYDLLQIKRFLFD